MSNDKLTDETGRSSLDPKHQPVSLPPRSFDIGELQKGLDHAAGLKAENRDASIEKALNQSVAKVDEVNPLDRVDPSSMPGHKFIEVEHPELGVVERTQVFDPAKREEAEAADEAADAKRDLAAGQAGRRTTATKAAADAAPKE